MENFVKALDKGGEGFLYFEKKFPKLSDAKFREGVFVGPQIRKIFDDLDFKDALKSTELAAWKSFKNAVCGFLGNQKEENFQ